MASLGAKVVPDFMVEGEDSEVDVILEKALEVLGNDQNFLAYEEVA